ncbi:MAG: aminotransferase class I/II-fold pyridoxal phosphate-dependent enzyme [Gemmatimonadetes bacterium]|nr:aminotransferase class I/II-fold pyridoxal phosphate-dependent enzyme [Gemmatimonadota bacterium]
MTDPKSRLAEKVGTFRPSLTLELKRLAAARVARGLPVYDFGLGETKGDLAPHIAEAGARAFRDGETMYGDPAGLSALRDAALRWLGLERQYAIENVVITSGAKQGLFNIFLALCNPGDTVLFDAAPWVSYQPMAIAADARVALVQPSAGAGNFLKVTAEDLRRELRNHPDARLFLLNSPVNPTSQLYSTEELEALLSVCVERQVYFVLDRLYWRLVFDGAVFPEPRVDEETRPWLIQVDGLSKNFRRTGGIRLGWTVAPTDVARAMVNLQSHYTSGPAIPTQHAALAGITASYDVELRDDLERKRNLLLDATCNIPQIKVWPTPAAFYSFWDVRACLGKTAPDGRRIDSSAGLATYLLDSAGVITAPGSAFMQEGYLRNSFATPDEHIVEGCRAVGQALATLR